MAYKTTDHFLVSGIEVMNLRSDDGNKYGNFSVPIEAKRLIEEHPDWPFPYVLDCTHEEPSLWGGYSEEKKEIFLKQISEGKVEWSNPNKRCKHCGRIYDPSYEFIESEVLLNFCNCGTEEYPEDRFPDYCPECIEKCYEYCTDAVAAFARDDVIKEDE